MQLSKLENKAYETLRANRMPFFTIRDLVLLIGIDGTKAYNLVKALKRKGAIKTLKSGKYTFSDINEFVIGSYLNRPSYVSFLSALNYYGYSDNMPNRIIFASTRYSRELEKFKYVYFSPRKFFGYTLAGEITIADKEKAFIDSLMLPKYSNGVRHVRECLALAIDDLDMKKLVSYALRLGMKSVIRRLGYMLEELRVSENYLKPLSKNIGCGYELLNPSTERANNLNRKWLLDINTK